MALMTCKPPRCTTLPAALCEKHFSRRKPRQRLLNAPGVPSGGDFGLSWLCLGKLWAALGRLLAALGLPRRPLGRLCGPFSPVLCRSGRFRASPAHLQPRFGDFWGRPRLDFLCVPHCFCARFGTRSLDCAVTFPALPLRCSSPVVCFCCIGFSALRPGAGHLR